MQYYGIVTIKNQRIMAHADGLIKAPVDVYGDIAAVLGISSGDVGTLCLSPGMNLMSRRKPTQYTGLDSPDPAQPRGSDSSATDYYDGTKSYGVSKPYFNLLDVRYSGWQTGAFACFAGAETANLLSNRWTQVTPTKYRVLDFDGYVYGNMSYPETGTSKPYVTPVVYTRINQQTLIVSTTLRYAYNDILHADYTKAGYLGMRSLLGLDAFSTDGEAYLGILMYAPTQQTTGWPNRTVPMQALMIKLGTTLGTTDSSEEVCTGDNRMIAIERTLSSDLFGSQSQASSLQSSKFIIGENVYFIPVLCRRNVSNNGWNIFNLAVDENTAYGTRVLTFGGSSNPKTCNVGSLSITYRINKRSDGAVVFYIQYDSSLVMTTSGTNTNIYFSDGTSYSAGPGDGNSTVVQFSNVICGTTYDNVTYKRWYSPKTATMYASQVLRGYSDTASIESRAGSFILKPYTSASTFRISVQIKYLKDDTIDKFLTGYADVSTSVQTGDTVTVSLS